MRIYWLALAVVTIGPAAVGVALLIRKVSLRAAREKWPFQELTVRPAGESTRRETLVWSEKLTERMMLVIALPIVLFVVLWQTPRLEPVGLAVVFGIALVGAIVTLRLMTRALEKWRSYNLGFEGERFVGAELDQLVAHGFQVCHDVPFGKWNIDHVVVGPTGVWAVETKTRRKPKADGRTTDWTVRVHADALEFPWGRERFGLEQAERNAKSLREWLTKATGDPVEVRPVLVLPGWMIDRKARNPVMVLSGRKAAHHLGKGPHVLQDETIRRIASQLREKSRVDFGR